MHREHTGPWDDDRDEERSLADALNRRHLLGAAAGGLALAASGLLLPDQLVEVTEAADHPVRRVQRRKEKKREKQRDRLEKLRDQQRREAGQGGRGGVFFKDVALTVSNELDVPLSADYWTEFNGHWAPNYGGNVDARREKTFSTKGVDHVAYVPFYRYLIEVNNPYAGTPWVTLAWGGVMGRGGWGGGTKVVDRQALAEFESTSMTVEGYRFLVQRTKDDNDFKHFTLRVQRA